jgi:hypothetical protein
VVAPSGAVIFRLPSTRKVAESTEGFVALATTLLVVVASGLALVVNTSALALTHHRWAASLTSGLVAVVSLTSALLLALTAPFLGGFVADGRPIDVVTSDLEAGAFAR